MTDVTKRNWFEQDESKATYLALLLVFFYSLPIYLGLLALIQSDWMQEPSLAVDWFAAFLATSDSSLSEFHKVLLPAMSAISAAVYAKRPSGGMYVLAVFVFVSFLVALFVTISFDIGSVKNGIDGLDSGLTSEGAKKAMGVMRETLLMYFMMLTGLAVANKKTSA